MEGYTRVLYDVIDDGEINPEDVIEFLNNQSNFRTFGDALEQLITKYFNTNNPFDYFKKCAKDKNIEFNRNTLKNWFESDKRPKKGEASRVHMYKIAFALGLTLEQTSELFNKVYFDRPFDMRNINEFVYVCCLNNNFSYQKAQAIILEIDKHLLKNNHGHTIHTSKMFNNSLEISSEKEIKEYIYSNAENFDYQMLSAKRIRDKLIDDIIVKDDEIDKTHKDENKKIKYVIDKSKIDYDSSIIARELASSTNNISLSNDQSLKSTSTMLDVIYGFNFSKLRERKEKLIKNTNLLSEIKSRFPSKQSFTKKNPSYEELRKMIILLKSYEFWFNMYDGNPKGVGFDDYIEEVNDYLNSANLPLLYAGNPYDWFFLYCTMTPDDDSSLELFREMLLDIFEF